MSLDKANGMLEDMSREIGYTATTALVDYFGGQSLWIPTTADDLTHPICRIIGERPFARLVAEYGGQTLNLRLDYRREINRRNRLIGALLAKGLGSKEIGKIAFMTERQVYNIKTELENAGLLPHILHAGVMIAIGDDASDEMEAGDVIQALRKALTPLLKP